MNINWLTNYCKAIKEGMQSFKESDCSSFFLPEIYYTSSPKTSFSFSVKRGTMFVTHSTKSYWILDSVLWDVNQD